MKKLWATIAVAVLTILVTSGHAHSDPVDDTFSGDSIVLVVDVSGSMSGTPLAQAKSALDTSVASISDDVAVGLRSYAGGCGNGGNLLVEVGLDNRTEISNAVAGLSAGGGTPTPDALRAAVGDLPTSGSRTVVLISDGASSCGPACPVAAELLASEQVDFTVFTVGFNAPQSAAADLTCVADTTGGSYVQATDTDSLVDAIGGATSSRDLVIRTLVVSSILGGEIDNDVEIRARVKVELPNGDDAIAAVVSVDGEVAGVTGADGVTEVSILIDPFWSAGHPDGIVTISATLGSRSGNIEAEVFNLIRGSDFCSYDGFPRGGNELGLYLSFLMPSAGGKVGEILERINNFREGVSTSLEVVESLKPKDVRTTVWSYSATPGIADPVYVLQVTVDVKEQPLSTTYWIVSKDEDLVDLAPKTLFGKLAGNCRESGGIA